ncbi:F-box/FBD/LRR-repeat protein At1g13570-like [Ipomoea triloba]|uniref:F-box/FBD/LRR-repeat protein At1g13570-like n=1 Tax=Ipomoea triloba TaxID=35885 RepID=UPI00125E3510|nr:F-box/FBD/LRR-repeat protein At1g13570-like [Ipomoea triloba]
MDVISSLPAEVKERILERLPIRDAARTAVLSTRWKDAWLRLGRLVFDREFFESFSSRYEDDEEGEEGTAQISAINDIFLLRTGAVKKFTLHLEDVSDPKPRQCDLDLWCRFLSRNRNDLEELELFISRFHKLPMCIFSCRTIKRLSLGYFIFDLPIPRPGCIFPCLTSLAFWDVEFSDTVKGIGYTIPNLEDLSFFCCEGITNFEICSPKLERYTVVDSVFGRKLDDSRCFTRYLEIIKTLSLNATLVPVPCKNAEIARVTLPTAINLKTINLYELNVSCPEQLAFALQLLQNSPTLCELKIWAFNDLCCCDITKGIRLMEDPNSCIIKQDLEILDTITIFEFRGSTLEMLFVKTLLSKSPTLRKVRMMVWAGDNSEYVNSRLRELLLFPRASPKAIIFCFERKHQSLSLNNEHDIQLLFRTT